MATMDMVLDTLPTPDQSMEDTPHTPDPLSPAMLPHLSLLLLTPDPSMEDTPATMARERLRLRLRLSQRLRLMLSMATMDMVLDTLPTPDQSMEDTPPTPDQLSPAMLLDQWFPPLDTPPTMARERLRLNQRLMLMLFMAATDMVLDTLPTPDLSMEDTPPTPDQLSPAMLPNQLFPPLDTLPTPDLSMEDTPPTPDQLSPLSTPDLLSPLSTPEESMDTTKH